MLVAACRYCTMRPSARINRTWRALDGREVVPVRADGALRAHGGAVHSGVVEVPCLARLTALRHLGQRKAVRARRARRPGEGHFVLSTWLALVPLVAHAVGGHGRGVGWRASTVGA
jgi:hypothetical protein